MKTFNEIFASTKTTEECQRVLSLLLDTDEVIVDFNDENCFTVLLKYSIKISQVLSGIEIAYTQEFGVGDPYMLFEIERHILEVHLAIIEIFSVTPRIEDSGEEPLSLVSVSCYFDDVSLDFLKEFLEVTSTIDSIFLSKYCSVQPAVNNKFYPIISKIHNNYLRDLSLSNLCLLKEQFVSLQIIALLIGSGFESSDSTLSLSAPFSSNVNRGSSIDFGLLEDHIDSEITQTWQQVNLIAELSEVLILEARGHYMLIYKTGYSLIKKIMPLCYTYGGDKIEFYLSLDYEMFIMNSVFFTKQKAYITDDEYIKKQLTHELTQLQKNIPKFLLKPILSPSFESITNRFQELINDSGTKEEHLESYLKNHYRTLFGKKYNKCVSQIKIFHKNLNGEMDERRLDIALFDTIRNDWEIIELKKSNVSLVRTFRNIPTFCAAVTMGISQLQYYKDLIQQDSIKKKLKQNYDMNLEVPCYTLIIGSSKLDKDTKKCIAKVQDITIKTYTQLLDEAKLTYADSFE